MALLRGRMHPTAGPIVQVALRQPESVEEVTAFEALGYAIIDTGAAVSGLDEDLAIRLKLRPAGTLTLRRAGPEAQFLASLFHGELGFPGSNWPAFKGDLVGFQHLDVRHEGGVRVVAIIGRDLLAHATLVISAARGEVELRT